MLYNNVCIDSVAYILPPEIVTSREIESQLEPAYERLGLEPGRLERIFGIEERRFWHRGTLPSDMSVKSVNKAMDLAGIAPEKIGMLVHTSVCRDRLEPATAAIVNGKLKLPDEIFVYDVSNACLGFINGMVQVANMIELGIIEAGVVVGTECGRRLVETTIEHLNADESLTRQSLKPSITSLTIGSASVAAVLTSRSLSRTGHQLLGGSFRADASSSNLCLGTHDQPADSQMSPLMQTDCDQLLRNAIRLGSKTLEQFLVQMQWTRDSIDRTFCHQVSEAQSKLMTDVLKLDAKRDFRTVRSLGNTGSAALPVTLSLGLERTPPTRPENLMLLGVGSGLNGVILGIRWQPGV